MLQCPGLIDGCGIVGMSSQAVSLGLHAPCHPMGTADKDSTQQSSILFVSYAIMH
jgi:hypothetical protein